MSARGLRIVSGSLFSQHYYYRGVAISCPLRHYSGGTPTYYNPSTWPMSLSAPEIKRLLDTHLVNPGEEPNYESLAMMLDAKDVSAVTKVVREFIKPPPITVNLEEYLKEHLDPNTDKADTPIVERDTQIAFLDMALARKPGSEKREVAFSYSPRGSGKTQFLKRFVFKRRAEAMMCGRVIVRCCHTAAPWLATVQRDSKSSSNPTASRRNSIDKGFCELIRAHVEAVTGSPQDPSNYCDPHTAYATWMSETAWWFGIPQDKGNVDPLIILDNCEVLADQEHKSLVHISWESKKITSKPYTLLEAFCLAMPSPHAMVFFGSNAIDNTSDRFFLTMANMTNIGPLLPLSKNGSFDAMVAWEASKPKTVSSTPNGYSLSPAQLFFLAGGVPQLLRSLFVTDAKSFRNSRPSLKDKWFPQVYTCLLASSTKANVYGNTFIAVNPKWKKASSGQWTYHDAMIHSVGLYNSFSRRFMVAPITLVDAYVKGKGVPILPSQLHPFIEKIDTIFLKHETSLAKDELLKKSFLWAVYARYLLACWQDVTEQNRVAVSNKLKSGRQTNKKWVSLAKVFEGAVHPKQVSVLERYEVNLSRGMKSDDRRKLAVENAVTHFHGHASPHDACIWCREASTQTKKKAKAFAVPLQLRSGNAKAVARKLLGPKSRRKVPLVLSVDLKPPEILKGHVDSVVAINADEMSSVGWMWQTK